MIVETTATIALDRRVLPRATLNPAIYAKKKPPKITQLLIPSKFLVCVPLEKLIRVNKAITKKKNDSPTDFNASTKVIFPITVLAVIFTTRETRKREAKTVKTVLRGAMKANARRAQINNMECISNSFFLLSLSFIY